MQRIAYGKAHGFETNEGRIRAIRAQVLSRFHEVCLEMIRKYGVNQFKFDGTGNVNEVIPGSAVRQRFRCRHPPHWRSRAPPSPTSTSISQPALSPRRSGCVTPIRSGAAAKITISPASGRGAKSGSPTATRDTYEHIVTAGPLYPLNSLMLHGLIYARYAKNLGTDPGNDFTAEVHDYFGTGTQLQEMYITPSLLTKENWDMLAEAAKWSRQNAEVLRDTHWVGGDPGKLQVYGWASWSPKKAILVLRNPSDKPQKFSVDVGPAFEIPEGTSADFMAKSPWAADGSTQPIELEAGTTHEFSLAPFQVLTLEATPVVH